MESFEDSAFDDDDRSEGGHTSTTIDDSDSTYNKNKTYTIKQDALQFLNQDICKKKYIPLVRYIEKICREKVGNQECSFTVIYDATDMGSSGIFFEIRGSHKYNQLLKTYFAFLNYVQNAGDHAKDQPYVREVELPDEVDINLIEQRLNYTYNIDNPSQYILESSKKKLKVITFNHEIFEQDQEQEKVNYAD